MGFGEEERGCIKYRVTRMCGRGGRSEQKMKAVGG